MRPCEFAFQHSLWPRYYPKEDPRYLSGAQVHTKRPVTGQPQDEEEWHEAQEIFPPSPFPNATGEQPSRKSDSIPIPPSILHPPRNPCQPNSWPEASCYVLPPVLPLLALLPSDAAPKARITLQLLQRACDQLREVVTAPGPMPIRLVAVQQGRVLADEEVADLPADVSALGIDVPADELRIGVVYLKILVKPELTSQSGPLRPRTFASMPVLVLPPAAGVEMEDLFGAMIHAVRKEELEAVISRACCVQGGSRDLGYTGKLKGGRDDKAKIALTAEMLHGGLKRCSSESILSSKVVGVSCRWGDRQRFRCPSITSGSSTRASTDTSNRLSTESTSTSKDPQVSRLCKDGKMVLPPDQAEEIPDAESSDEFSKSGLQLEEQLPSCPGFLLETGDMVKVCPPIDASPSSFNDLPPPSPLRRFSLDTHELEGSKFQEVNRRSSMGSIAICGQLLASRGFHSVDSVLLKQPAAAYLSSSLYKQAQSPFRPSTRIPGSTRVLQPAQAPSAVQHPSLTPTGRSWIPPAPQTGKQSPAFAAAPSGASTSWAGSEASTGSSKPRGQWLRRSSPAGVREHDSDAGKLSSSRSVGSTGLKDSVEQQQLPRQELQPARAAAEQQRMVQQALEGEVPASSASSQHQVKQQASERTVPVGAQGEQQALERRAPAGEPGQSQGLEKKVSAGLSGEKQALKRRAPERVPDQPWALEGRAPLELSPASFRAMQARQQLLLKQQQELKQQREHKQEQQQEGQHQTTASHVLESISAPMHALSPPAGPSAAMPAPSFPATPSGAPMEAKVQLLPPRPCDPAVVLSKAQEPLPQVCKSSLSLQDQHHPTAGALAASMRSLIYASSPSVVASAYSENLGALSADLGFCLEAADHCSATRAVAAATGDPMPVCLSSIESQIEWSAKGSPPVALRGTDAGLVVATLKDLDALLSSQGMVACRALLTFAAEQMLDPAD